MALTSAKTVSLYIPVISKNITEYYVKQQFFQHNIGLVNSVDFVFNNQKKRREAFIHFKCWYTNQKATDLLLDITNEATKTQFIYYNKNFWPLLINKSSKDSTNENYVNEKKDILNVKDQVQDQNQYQPQVQNQTQTQYQTQVQNHLKEKLKLEHQLQLQTQLNKLSSNPVVLRRDSLSKAVESSNILTSTGCFGEAEEDTAHSRRRIGAGGFESVAPIWDLNRDVKEQYQF